MDSLKGLLSIPFFRSTNSVVNGSNGLIIDFPLVDPGKYHLIFAGHGNVNSDLAINGSGKIPYTVLSYVAAGSNPNAICFFQGTLDIFADNQVFSSAGVYFSSDSKGGVIPYRSSVVLELWEPYLLSPSTEDFAILVGN